MRTNESFAQVWQRDAQMFTFKQTSTQRTWKAQKNAFKVIYTQEGRFVRRRFYVILPTGTQSLVSDSLYVH